MERRQVEAAAVATWPASTVRAVGGWVVRHCGSVDRKRSNSALPPLEIGDPVPGIERIERFYAERGSRPVVQVSPLEQHGELDSFLDERGYRAESPTRVLVGVSAEVERACRAGDFGVRLDSGPHERWFAACAAVGSRVEPGLVAVPSPVRYATAEEEGEAVGVGLFAVAGEWCGIYCMATAVARRRQGVAGALLRAGARWAATAGADRLFLQVEQGNVAAERLYGSCGFVFSHAYHYRVGEAGSAVHMPETN